MTDKFVTAQSMSLIDQKTRVREGYLKKKSPKGFLAKVWQTRYLVLYDDVLQYFKDKRDANPAGVIPLQTVTKVYTQPDKHSGCRFDVVVGDESGANTRIFCFLTDTDRECDDWVRDLNELVKRFTQEEHKGLEIEARGKFWKNTTEIREARARSSASWGDQRYLLSEDEAKTPSSNSVSESDATSSDSIKTSGLRFGGLANDFASPIAQTRSLSGSVSRKNLEEPPIEAVKLLTEGSQGQIMLVRESATGTQFLMHAYRKNNALFPQYKQLMIDMADIVHPYIFQQVHTGECADAIFAVYTYPIDQSLFVHLRQHRRFPEHVARLFTAEVVLALGYLHKMNRLFLKLEPENIFLDEDGHACISDFLLCMPREHLPKEIHTPEYDTPEHLRGEKESSASDWWRLGVLLYELTVGFPPFRSKTHDAEELAQKIRSHKVEDLRFPPFLSPDAQDFIKQLLTVDISGRLGGSALDAEDVKKHPFFKDINWPQLECRQVSSPDWVDEMLQNERRSARDAAIEAAALSGIAPPIAKLATVTVHVIEARGLPGLKPNGVTSDPYVKVMCDKQNYKTKAIVDTVKPRWDEKFNVEVANPNAEIELRVYHNDDSVVKHARIGMVTLPVAEIRAVKFINAWYSIIGQDCIAHGEVHLSLAWADKPIVKSLDPPTKASRAFIDLFPVRSTPSGSVSVPYSISSSSTISSPPTPKSGSVASPAPPAPLAAFRPPGALSVVPVRNISDGLSSPRSPLSPVPQQTRAAAATAALAAHKTSIAQPSGLSHVIRSMVSKNKLRFEEEGFDLDLSYITDRIIAMGFPSENLSGVYRNPMGEVQRFMNHFHASRYKVYNLCIEEQYEHKKFDGRVAEFPFFDHNCPEFNMLLRYCYDVTQWLAANPQHVAATHCKAGKGRTGLCISSYLVYSRACVDAEAALTFFAQRRTSDGKGVTIPSQKRYVQYIDRYMRQFIDCNRPFPHQHVPLVLKKVRMTTVPNFDVGGGCDPYFIIKRPDGKLFYDYRKTVPEIKNYKKEPIIEMDNINAVIQGDVKFMFFDYDALSADDKMFWFWINTTFVDNHYLCFTKNDLDGAIKDKHNKMFDPHFKIELYFEPAMERAALSVFEIDQKDLQRMRIGEEDDGDD